MKNFKKILALLLTVIFIASMLVACGDNGGGTDDPESTGKQGQIEAGNDDDPKIDAVDYDGYEFTFLTQESNDYGYKVRYIVSQGEEGNLFDDAIAKRNAVLEEKYNITIVQYDAKDVISEVRTQVMGGALSFDVVLANSITMSTLAKEGYLYNLLDIDRFDMDKSYWDKSASTDLKIGGKLYFTNCALNTHSIGTAVYFNKKLIQDFQLTSPYEYIKNNQWTLDNWAGLVKSISRDVNNDGAMTELDMYGQIGTHSCTVPFLYASGIRFTKNDETGYPKVAFVDNSDKLVSVYEKLKDVFSNQNINYCITCSTVGDNGYAHKWEYIRHLFTQDLYLFDYTSDDVLTIYKDMESEFGIIPFPKYDSKQDTYLTYYPTDFNLFALPAIVKDINRTGNIVEDMNYYSSIIVEPVWFDTLLTRRYTRDDESEATLRDIKENRIYDIGLYYDFGDFKTKVLFEKIDNINIMREYQRYSKAIEASIRGTFKDFTSKQ